ncbi:MAG: HlyC/CorC family transporter [Lachnospiraceae bacterium]|nr:HlyC/CorC family transporter [Lachnospiraceae bacterium]MBR4060175.1 HlyC/CorC family transporter [Lachnospiraceae bacterium]
MDSVSCTLYVFFLLCSAYFACSETAYTAVSKVRLRTMADKGNKRAVKALWICERFDKTLTTILIGNNIFHASCASLSALLVMREFAEEYVVYGTIVTTLIVYLFAEMIPKSLAKARSEKIALLFASSMSILVKLLTPLSALFSGISALLSRFLASDETTTVTEEELISIIETIEDEGVLEPEKQALVNSAMEFRDKLAEDIMIPMSGVTAVSSTIPLDKLAEIVQTSSYSRLPVYEGSRDNIVGILPVNLFLTHYVTGKQIHLRKLLMKPYVFNRKTEISELLQRMRLNKLHMIFVTDENNKKLGIITMEDLLEELVGDIQDESDAGEGLQLM